MKTTLGIFAGLLFGVSSLAAASDMNVSGIDGTLTEGQTAAAEAERMLAGQMCRIGQCGVYQEYYREINGALYHCRGYSNAMTCTFVRVLGSADGVFPSTIMLAQPTGHGGFFGGPNANAGDAVEAPTMMAQPTGHGGFFGGGNANAGDAVEAPTMMAQPTGHGGFFGGPNANAGDAAGGDMPVQTAMIECTPEMTEDECEMVDRLNKNKEKRASTEAPTMMAQPTGHGGFFGGGNANAGDAVEAPTMMAQPTGHGGFFGGGNANAGDAVEAPTMMAQPTGHGGFFGGGNANAGDAVEAPTMMAQPTGHGGFFGGGNANAGDAVEPSTMHANLRIGDPQPGGSCATTDAWACFGGTDNSPVLRDVGIFAYDDGQQGDPWGGNSGGGF